MGHDGGVVPPDHPPLDAPDPEGALGDYRRKRDFAATAEPAGGAPAPSAGVGSAPLRYVVQRHRARRLHYDVRLELDGVLVSWAVPKGPTLDPTVRRAAFHVEDHPIEYLDFEGVIPAGQYGGGDVIVWDIGTWAPAPDKGRDPAASLAAGELHFDLVGTKLRGRFVLVRTRGRRGGSGAGVSGEGGGKDEWLLLHKHDEWAVEGWDPEAHPRSVRSGRTNDEVRATPERLWHSGRPAAEAEERVRPAPPPIPPVGDPALAALDALGPAGTWEVHGRSLEVTNLDKVLFPAREGEPAVTKRDLIRYAAQIGPVLVPYLAGRALTMHRFPNGADRPGFWHKALPSHAPDWLGRWDNPRAKKGETRTYLVVDEPAALVWAANYGALEWHAWTSTTATSEEPSYALIDLDPGPATAWPDLVLLARLHRDALHHLGVAAAAKVTGRRGIQIWVPVVAGLSFGDTREWVEHLSRTVGRVVPDLVSWEWQVAERSGRARLDYTQNARHKTLVAPYSPRPAPGAPVSAPISWEELDDPDLTPDRWTLRTILGRVATHGDLFAPVLRDAQALPPLA